MRQIDADALLEILQSWRDEAERLNAPVNYKFASAIIAQVERMPTIEERKTGQWIPCSERLPIKAGHYLCSFEKPNRIDRIYVDLAYWTGDRWHGYRTDAITAWMPLPKPYMEEEK